MLAATFGLILLINKLVCGTFFPGRKDEAQPVAPKPPSEHHGLFPVLVWVAGLTGCGLLTLYVLKYYNSSRHELYLGALIAPLILLALINGLLYLRRRS